MHITAVPPERLPDHIDALAAILVACTRTGASVGYGANLDMAKAKLYWSLVLDQLHAGHCLLLIARDQDGMPVGTAQLNLHMIDNQRHRAEVQMLLVHPSVWRCGVARALLQAIEVAGRTLDRNLLTLQTARGAPSEALYQAAGYRAAGFIPGYALWPDGTPCDYVFYWKRIV